MIDIGDYIEYNDPIYPNEPVYARVYKHIPLLFGQAAIGVTGLGRRLNQHNVVTLNGVLRKIPEDEVVLLQLKGVI